MGAQAVWAGLGDSVFLAGPDDRERDPGRLATTAVGGVVLGLVAASCGFLIVTIAYALLIGQGERGLAGLAAAARVIGDPEASSPGLIVLRLVVATAVDGVFLLVFVAVAAALIHQPLRIYVTAGPRLRWRLLLAGLALSALAMAPMVVAERLLSGAATPPPFLSISPMAGDRIVYCLSALLLIPAAAAEELFFRGWLLRQTGAFVRKPWLLIAVTSLTFSALHLDFNPDAFLTRALMGAGFAYMTLRLGGIEFSTAAHSVNNLMIVLFLQPLRLDQAPGPDISAFSLFEDVALIGGYVLITELVARAPALRRLAGVRFEDLSPSRRVSAHFG